MFSSNGHSKDFFVYMGDGSSVPVAGIGTARIKIKRRTIKLPNVRHVPDLDCNIMSITRHGLHGQGCSYVAANGERHLSFPAFTLHMPIPADGNPIS